MESLPSQNPNLDNQNLIHLVGPDGWQFSVSQTPEKNTQFQLTHTTEKTPQALDSPAINYSTETHTEVPPATPEQVQQVESIDGSAVMASMIATGVMKWRVKRQRKAIQRQVDTESHSEAASLIQERHDDVPEYNPLGGWQKTHRTNKIPDGGLVMAKHPPVQVTSARTRTQNRAALRANLREDAINNRVGRADKYIDLHGEVILDKADLKDELRNGRYSKQQRKAMKRAGRKARRLLGTSGRIDSRLDRQARGDDLHGKKIKAVQKITRS